MEPVMTLAYATQRAGMLYLKQLEWPPRDA